MPQKVPPEQPLPPDLWPRLAAAAEAATIAISRYDARLQSLAAGPSATVAEGALARAHVFEAQALVGLMGGQCPLEDIVLNDARMDARLPSTEVVKAVSLLALRRSLARRKAAEIMTPAAIRDLLAIEDPARAEGPAPAADPPMVRRGLRPWDMPGAAGILPEDEETEEEDLPPLLADDEDAAAPPYPPRRAFAALNVPAREEESRDILVSDPDYDEPGRLGAWLGRLEGVEELPAALAAAVTLDDWFAIEPSEHRGESGFLLASGLLRARGLARMHLPTLALGCRRSRFRWSPHQPLHERLAGLLGAAAEAARAGDADLDRLILAREVMLLKCRGRSRNSRLADFVELFVASPLVTVQFAARRLGVTPQAVEAMLRELGASLPRELTGRKRYRAWGIV